MLPPTLRARADALARRWGLDILETSETATSLLAFGQRKSSPIVLKVIRDHGDEWHSGTVIQAFDGHGMVRAYEATEGAVLLERLTPGTALVRLTLAGSDDLASEVLAGVIHRLSVHQMPTACPSVHDWGNGFATYLAGDDQQISRALVERSQAWYLSLAASQRDLRLLHGDLQHYNVLYDNERGWLAIDPKGVVGEREYELGACLRNPGDSLADFVSPRVIERRLELLGRRLPLSLGRALAWAYAQAVLSAIWMIEDGGSVPPDDPTISLASTIERMLPPCP